MAFSVFLAKLPVPILVKFIYSEKTTKIWEISKLLLSVDTVDKSKVEILQIWPLYPHPKYLFGIGIGIGI